MARKLTGLGLTFEKTHAARTAEKRPPVLLAPNAAGTARASMRILAGDRNGRIRGELVADVAGVAWKLNAYGQARFTLATADATAQEDLLQFGNRIVIQFENGLPDWGGVIDTPRKWKSGTIEVVAYSAEYLLGWRVTSRGRYFQSRPAGAIFKALLTEARPIGISLGNVWMGGTLHSPEYHYRELYDIVKNSLTDRIESADWDVRPTIVNGQILFSANYYEQKGTDHGRRVRLLEGVNAVQSDLAEQGTIANEVFLAGAGSGWSDNNRIYATASDADSQGLYGLRQAGEIRVDIKEQDTLDANAALALATSKGPRTVVSVDAMDLPPGRFRQYDVGDVVWLELYENGFDGYEAPVRVLAREYLPESNTCSLVIE